LLLRNKKESPEFQNDPTRKIT